ncbi:MAG: hypothetical protein IKP65_01330 [Alphaproteobacteria bacterium]|nr:hypothetical protein [Alphaproteobacteria bacterium]
MNLEICEKECNICAVIYNGSYLREADLIDKNFRKRIDLPCQKHAYGTSNYWHCLYDKNISRGIEVEKKTGIKLETTLYYKKDKQTKCFHAGKDCPFYAEHFLFDEN